MKSYNQDFGEIIFHVSVKIQKYYENNSYIYVTIIENF